MKSGVEHGAPTWFDAVGRDAEAILGYREWPFRWLLDRSVLVEPTPIGITGALGPVRVELWTTELHHAPEHAAEAAVGPRAERWNCCAVVLRQLLPDGRASTSRALTVVNAVPRLSRLREWELKRSWDHIYHQLTGLDILFNDARFAVPRAEALGHEDGDDLLWTIAADGVQALLAWGAGRALAVGHCAREDDPVATTLDALSAGVPEVVIPHWRGVAGVDARRWIDGGVGRVDVAAMFVPVQWWEEQMLTAAGRGWPDPAEWVELAEKLIHDPEVAMNARKAGWSLGDVVLVLEAVGGDWLEDEGWVARDWIEAFIPHGTTPAELASLLRTRPRDDEEQALQRVLEDLHAVRALVARPVQAPAPAGTSLGDKPKSEAKQSIRYMAQMALGYGKVGSLTELLDSVVAFGQYKPFQALLVLLQRPAASYVLPAHHWEERLGWVVRPNEQPLVLLQPQGPVMFMFDVSQVEPGPHAQPLPPRLRNPYEMRDVGQAEQALRHVIENAKLDGVRVHDAGIGLRFAGCAFRSESAATQVTRGLRLTDPPLAVAVRFEVLLNRSYSATEQLATLAHELGHIYCGHLGEQPSEVWVGKKFWKDRRSLSVEMRELEAESVAKVVFQSLAPSVELPDHLRQYFDSELSLDAVNLEPILTVAGRVLEMSAGFAPRRPRT